MSRFYGSLCILCFTDVRSRVTPVKSVYLLNVVVKQEILIKKHRKTKQATSCRVTCNRVPFITCYCIFIHVRIAILYTDKNTPYV